MGSIVGGITDAVGLTNNKGEKQAAANAATANAQSYAMSKEQIELAKEQLQFQKDQYTDWKNIYGDVQENLGNYYKNLTPDKLVALGLENQQREFQQVEQSIKRDFAQRGLSNSGNEVNTIAVNKVQNATARAAIRTNAAETVNAQKMNFLGLGLGQGTQMLGIINSAAGNANNAYTTGVNARTNMASSYLGQQTQFSTNNTNAMGDVIGSFAGNYMGGR